MDWHQKNIQDLSQELENTKQELQKYKRIVEYMAESIWIGDKDEKTVYANPNFCELLGYSLDEIIGWESYKFRDEESSKVVFSNNLLRKEGAASKYEGVLRAKDGTLIPVFCSGTPIPWGWTVWIMTDLRQLKNLEKSREELRQINQAKDEFISIVWHELRTPLTITDGYLSMILDGDMGEVNDIAFDAIKKVYSSNKWLIQMVNDMLDLSKIEMGILTYNDEFLDIVAESRNLYQDLFFVHKNKEIIFEFEVIGESWDTQVCIDRHRFRQVITNLVNNAFKFTEKWGKIDFKIIQKPDTFLFEVIDTGIGICQEEIDKIFYKFHQVESYFSRSNEWLWLWLSIISWIVHHYNSQIHIESELWKWSKFFFELKKIKSE